MADISKISFNGAEYDIKDEKATSLANQALQDIATEVTNRQSEIAIERARINQFTALGEGSTTGDAELVDIRVGADSTEYTTAGEAVRAQVSKKVDKTDIVQTTGDAEDKVMSQKAVTRVVETFTTEGGGNTADIWEQGAYSLGSGLPANSSVRIRTKGYIPTVKSITTDDKYVFELLAYDETDTYIGSWNVSEFSKATAEKLTSLDFSLLSAYAYKYKLKFYRLNGATITPEEGYTHIHFHNEIFEKLAELDKNLQSDITDVKTIAIENGANIPDLWEQGGIGSMGNFNDTRRIRTIGYLSKNVSRIHVDDGYCFYVVFYDDENNLVGFWTKNGITLESDAILVTEFDLSAFSEYNIRLMLRKIDNTDVTVEEYTHIHFVNRIDRQIDDNKKICEELDIRTKEDLNNESLWENGGVGSDGSLTASNYNLRTKDYVSDDVSLIYVEKGYYFRLLAYAKSGEFVGIWDRNGFSSDSRHTMLYYMNVGALKNYNLLVLVRRLGGGTIDISEHSNIHFLNKQQAKIFYPTPTLTFIDDDGAKNALENWEAITDETGVKITSALNTGVMGDGDVNPRKASWDDVARLQSKGYEFVSHTHHHINLTEKTEEQIHTDLAASAAALREHGCESRYLVYPYNAINENLIPIVRKYFTAAVGIGTGSDNVLPVYTYHLRRHSINDTTVSVEKEYNGEIVSVHSFKSLDTLKSYIDTAIINGGWLIIMTHLRNDGMYYHDEESKQMIIDLCKYATEKGMKIQTFGEAFERYKNIMENPHAGSIYAERFYIADCNGVVHSKE